MLLAWASFARPQAAPIVPLISLYVLVEFGWTILLKYPAAGATWGRLFAATMLFFFGRILAPTYAVSTAGVDFQHGLLLRTKALPFSLSHGMLIFVPIFLLSVYLIVRHWRDQHAPRASSAGRHRRSRRRDRIVASVVGWHGAPRRAMIWTAAALSIAVNANGTLSLSSAPWNLNSQLTPHPRRLRALEASSSVSLGNLHFKTQLH